MIPVQCKEAPRAAPAKARAQRNSAVVPAVVSQLPAQPHEMSVPREAGLTDKQMLVAAHLSPSVGAARVVKHTTHRSADSEIDFATASWYFKQAAEQAASGDLSKLQQMLAVQARTLDLVYNEFLLKAGSCAAMDNVEQCMRLAMKAQSQCRTTVETLAVIQQGPKIFAKQANIAHGHQQVNNTPPALVAAPPPTVSIRARRVSKKPAERTIQEVAR